jgi:alkylhydroperoxidase family enzyme
LLAYADKLTRDAAAVDDADLERLRAHGFDEAQLWEATFKVALFNFVTRMADAFGMTPLPAREAAVGLGRTDELNRSP